MKLNEPGIAYGQDDATYLAAGAAEGVAELVEHFYKLMDSDPRAAPLRRLHDEDLTESANKLRAFLSGWMGGPNLYQQTYGSISIPSAHAHLSIDQGHAEQWLFCMQEALKKMSYPVELQAYLMEQFSFPVNMILRRSEQQQSGKSGP